MQYDEAFVEEQGGFYFSCFLPQPLEEYAAGRCYGSLHLINADNDAW